MGCRLVTPHSVRNDRTSSNTLCAAARLTLFGVLDGNSSDFFPSDDEFLDLRSAVPNLQAHYVGMALMERQVRGVAVVAVGEETLVNDLAGHLGHVPLAHRRFCGVGYPTVPQRQRVVAELSHHSELG